MLVLAVILYARRRFARGSFDTRQLRLPPPPQRGRCSRSSRARCGLSPDERRTDASHEHVVCFALPRQRELQWVQSQPR